MLVAHLHVRRTGGNRDLVFGADRIGAHRCPAVLIQGSPRIRERNLRARSRRWPCPGRQVHGARTDMHAHAGRLISVDIILLDGNKGIRFDRIGCAVHESEPGRPIIARTDKIAAVERAAVVGIFPGD